MSKEEVIKYLLGKVKELENKLKDLDSQISKLTKEREMVARAFDSYRYTLENESQEGAPLTPETKIAPHKFADLPVHRAAEIVLKDTARGMTTREIAEEISKRGKRMHGPNVTTIIYSSLKRFPDLFKKEGHVWTLIIREEETKAA
ncbi:MAG: hypothetical protein A3G40_07705 [Deltaproteobacteria bacterium RIFCSPLOWO2_12_FULL_57_22]|nr:MAG: hypothetical protein A3G40_07705 [Deltaproteobacteria bacterium RIFCSPLOWO2_12_FULL_57_22]